MDFGKVQWLFPAAVTLHKAEEAICMPGWNARCAAELPLHPQGALKIRIALVVPTLAGFVVTYLCLRRGPRNFWAYLTFGYIVAMFG